MVNGPWKTTGLAKFSSNFRASQSCSLSGYLRLAILHKAVSQSLRPKKFSKFRFVFSLFVNDVWTSRTHISINLKSQSRNSRGQNIPGSQRKKMLNFAFVSHLPFTTDHSDHGKSNESMIPLWSRIHRSLRGTMIRVILDHWHPKGTRS